MSEYVQRQMGLCISYYSMLTTVQNVHIKRNLYLKARRLYNILIEENSSIVSQNKKERQGPFLSDKWKEKRGLISHIYPKRQFEPAGTDF